ncbi:hypothetical protein OAJ65_03790 [Flavobacteriales bacterium]|nr:hypothetical protein [Flavobacteriales bacterium]
MKNLFFLGTIVLFLAACTNVNFVSPQPEFVDALIVIPEKYHGEFLIDKDWDKHTHTITSSTINGISISSDSLVVKERGNYFYINTMNDSGHYELRIIRLTKFLNHESIFLYAPLLENIDKVKLFNVLNIEPLGDDEILLDNVTINQLSILTNSSEKYKVQRLE